MEVETHMSAEESDMITQLFGAQCSQDYNPGILPCFSPSYYSGNWAQEDTYIGINWEGNSGYCNLDATKVDEDIIYSKSIKRNCEMSKLNSYTEAPGKKARIFKTNAWEENEGISNMKSLPHMSSCLSENVSSGKFGALDSSVKYTKNCLNARKRREKISQRLRMLQELIPNGTKVDISTMLEEAYQYVKFLQLQIKLLSSDDLWMYAPVAFNGMNDELNLDFCQAQQFGIKMR